MVLLCVGLDILPEFQHGQIHLLNSHFEVLFGREIVETTGKLICSDKVGSCLMTSSTSQTCASVSFSTTPELHRNRHPLSAGYKGSVLTTRSIGDLSLAI